MGKEKEFELDLDIPDEYRDTENQNDEDTELTLDVPDDEPVLNPEDFDESYRKRRQEEKEHVESLKTLVEEQKQENKRLQQENDAKEQNIKRHSKALLEKEAGIVAEKLKHSQENIKQAYLVIKQAKKAANAEPDNDEHVEAEVEAQRLLYQFQRDEQKFQQELDSIKSYVTDESNNSASSDNSGSKSSKDKVDYSTLDPAAKKFIADNPFLDENSDDYDQDLAEMAYETIKKVKLQYSYSGQKNKLHTDAFYKDVSRLLSNEVGAVAAPASRKPAISNPMGVQRVANYTSSSSGSDTPTYKNQAAKRIAEQIIKRITVHDQNMKPASNKYKAAAFQKLYEHNIKNK
jgi:hypothetical protein